MSASTESGPGLVSRCDFPVLFDVLSASGYDLIGPTVRDQAIVYDKIDGVEDLPIGWTDEQDAGTYRLKHRADAALFGFNVGPDSWKKFLHRPSIRLWKADKSESGIQFRASDEPAPKQAFIGIRSCELHAVAIQDRVLIQDRFVDPHYASRRRNIFTVAVQCTQAARTCFCSSMDSGPEVRQGYDLVVTELIDGDGHRFVIDSGSAEGAEILKRIPHRKARPADLEAARGAVAEAGRQITRRLDTQGIRDLLYRNAANSHWEKIAERCLACTNCTMVCPTCFCTAVEDVTDLEGGSAERTRRWDSCFTSNFSYLHGGSIRQSTASRYRQWMTHKLASWQDQFGSSGCVGCGRCISWCPVGIDITEEAATIRKTDIGADRSTAG
jgi:sulfhydrogenase subunit beta (sulfur reductase)